ncbi:hypothetical protein K439DRAFT_1624651 [Ramaria rubella]|nr:hypothetical protein K439DRAFT_1624651 [Ramaria rubella]
MPYYHLGLTRRTRSRIYLSPRMQQLLHHIQTAGILGDILSWSFEAGCVAPYEWPRHPNGAFVATSGLKVHWANNDILPPLCLHGSKVGNELSILQTQCTIRPTHIHGARKYRLVCPFEGTDSFCGYMVLLPSRPMHSNLISARTSNGNAPFEGNINLAPVLDENVFSNTFNVPAAVMPRLLAVAPPLPSFPPAGLWMFTEAHGPPLPQPLPFVDRTADYRALICLATTTGLAPDHMEALFASLERCRYCDRSFIGPAFEAHREVNGVHGCERLGGSGFGTGIGKYKGLGTWSRWSPSASRSYQRRLQQPAKARGTPSGVPLVPDINAGVITPVFNVFVL